ncbi:MAG UNVERIFIED_CONTAM: hypothetical protein LVR29_31970 [Microcystis novacekii LVE1205-3]
MGAMLRGRMSQNGGSRCFWLCLLDPVAIFTRSYDHSYETVFYLVIKMVRTAFGLLSSDVALSS